MTLHLLLNTIIAIGIILALSKKYMRQGLLVVGFGFLVQAIFSYMLDKDVVLSLFEAFAGFSALYEYRKALRRRNYAFTKRTQLVIGSVITLLGIWYLTIGILSPFLVAGAVCLAVIFMRR